MTKNQKLTVTLIATTAALIGVLIGILSYFKKKSAEFDESWDYSYAYDDCDCDGECNFAIFDSDEDFDESILVEEENI